MYFEVFLRTGIGSFLDNASGIDSEESERHLESCERFRRYLQ